LGDGARSFTGTFTYYPSIPLLRNFLRRVFLWGGAALAFVAMPGQVCAQASTRTFVPQYHGWLVFNSEPRFSKQWGMRAELILRRAESGKVWQQIQTRVAPVWNPRPDLQLSVGYLFSRNFPYGKYPVAHVFSENRLYEQLLLRSEFGRFVLMHRYRIEQRWNRPWRQLGTPDAGPVTVYVNRARYFTRLTRPLGKSAIGPYAAVSGEVFAGFGRNVGPNILEQARAYGGLGWQLNSAMAVEAGYLHQLIQQGNGQIFEANNTLQLTLNFNPNFAGSDTPRPTTNDSAD
jgi:Protein of unknown function (DUF2490)